MYILLQVLTNFGGAQIYSGPPSSVIGGAQAPLAPPSPTPLFGAELTPRVFPQCRPTGSILHNLHIFCQQKLSIDLNPMLKHNDIVLLAMPLTFYCFTVYIYSTLARPPSPSHSLRESWFCSNFKWFRRPCRHCYLPSIAINFPSF